MILRKRKAKQVNLGDILGDGATYNLLYKDVLKAQCTKFGQGAHRLSRRTSGLISVYYYRL